MKLLVRKGLTQSDVGELGRIILPKARMLIIYLRVQMWEEDHAWIQLLLYLRLSAHVTKVVTTWL